MLATSAFKPRRRRRIRKRRHSTGADRKKQFRDVAGVVLSTSGMCEAQRIDYNAARRRVITWRAHFERWGNG